MAVDINIDASAAFTYAVWIDYDSVERRLSVYVDQEANPKPDKTIVEVNLGMSSSAYGGYVNFGLFSTVAQHLSVHRWEVTVQDIPYCSSPLYFIIPAFAVYLPMISVSLFLLFWCYKFLKRTRNMKRLNASMSRIPGMPLKLNFADIKKATGNFHETTKLGRGGFGTVYRCTLPADTFNTGQPIDVAVKRFTHAVQSRRYDDFVSEVSIINRLRHKNIVPLVGKYVLQ
jgi:interleukin-1 receptor-associated kinase 1